MGWALCPFNCMHVKSTIVGTADGWRGYKAYSVELAFQVSQINNMDGGHDG